MHCHCYMFKVPRLCCVQLVLIMTGRNADPARTRSRSPIRVTAASTDLNAFLALEPEQRLKVWQYEYNRVYDAADAYNMRMLQSANDVFDIGIAMNHNASSDIEKMNLCVKYAEEAAQTVAHMKQELMRMSVLTHSLHNLTTAIVDDLALQRVRMSVLGNEGALSRHGINKTHIHTPRRNT